MVEQIAKIVKQYDERLRRVPFVPRFSFRRRMPREDGAPNRLFLMYLFSYTAVAMNFLKDVGLLQSKVQCNICHRHMTWSA